MRFDKLVEIDAVKIRVFLNYYYRYCIDFTDITVVGMRCHVGRHVTSSRYIFAEVSFAQKASSTS